MKRITLLTMAFFLLAGLSVFATGGQEATTTESDEPVTVRYMMHSDRFDIYPKIDAIFETQNPNINVEYLVTPQGGANAVHDKYVTMLAAKDSSIDIFVSDVIWPPELAAAGWLLPLNDYFPPDEQKKHVAAMIDAQTVDGKIYGVPWLNDIGHLFYREDLLKDGGMAVPEFWSEMVVTSQKLMGPDMIGYIGCFFPDQQLICNYTEYLWSNGGQFLDSTGRKVKFTEKASVDAVQFMVDMVNKYKIVQPGITTMGLDDGRVIFTEGRAVFHRNWNYAYSMANDHPESKVTGLVESAVVPRFKNGPHSTTLGGWSFSVNAFTKHKEEAVKLALFLGGEEAQKIRAVEGSVTPSILPLLTDPDVLAKYPVYAAWQKEADGAKSRPKSPFYTQLSDIFQRELQEALILRKTPDQAMKDAAADIEMVIQ